MDPTRPLDRDLVPPPLNSPAKKDYVAPPPRSNERMSPRKGSTDQYPNATPLPASLKDRDVASPLMAPFESEKPELASSPGPVDSPSLPSRPTTASSQPASETFPPPPPEPADDEESRPGLGPMIRSKKSKGEIAGAIWKAASAVSAFRPRPGGAGDRLRQQAQSKPEEGPDGITGVVPAPPRAPSRPVSRDPKQASTPATPEPVRPSARESLVPEVKITVPTSRPSSVVGPIEDSKESQKKDESTKQGSRPSITAGNDAKYLQSLGLDPIILDERSEEFGKWLDYFGWIPGEQMRTRNVEEMRTDLERELNKAQAGGWLARFREEDERVDAIKKGIDIAITECEELDNLLTLYTVELSVCHTIPYLLCQATNLL